MPITCPISVRPITQDEFAQLDYQVMRHAFASQNELGRLCDEVIYQNDLAGRLDTAGLGPVRKECPVTLAHRDFTTTYYLDVVVGDAAIYELKVSAQLVSEYDAQLLNYLCLEGVHHGKLINFRPAQVESRFVNTTLTQDSRREFDVDTHRWLEQEEATRILRTVLLGLLEDWGAFLELPLYLKALTHFLGGEEKLTRLVPLSRNGVQLGNQRLHLLTADTAFRLTAMPDAAERYEQQLASLLRHSPLRAIQWVNVAGHRSNSLLC